MISIACGLTAIDMKMAIGVSPSTSATGAPRLIRARNKAAKASSTAANTADTAR